MQEALKLGCEVVIQSTRLARYEIDERTPYADHDVEVYTIREKLDKAGLHAVRLWLHDWKPGALMYVDDKSFPRFNPSLDGWNAALKELQFRLRELEHEKVVVRVPTNMPYHIIRDSFSEVYERAGRPKPPPYTEITNIEENDLKPGFLPSDQQDPDDETTEPSFLEATRTPAE